MPAVTLYLTSSATASPFPITSRLLSESANASEVSLGPGEFDSGFPGNTDAGQWNPSSAIADTTAAAEIDNTGTVPGTTRQGWLWNQDLTGKRIRAGAYTVQLRLFAPQGGGASGRICMRVSVVKGVAGAWTTIKQLFAVTKLTGETSHAVGHNGWRDNDGVRIAPTGVITANNFSISIGDRSAAVAHVFAADERLLFELGFCDADSTTDRTWRLDFNNADSFITTPVIDDAGGGIARWIWPGGATSKSVRVAVWGAADVAAFSVRAYPVTVKQNLTSAADDTDTVINVQDSNLFMTNDWVVFREGNKFVLRQVASAGGNQITLTAAIGFDATTTATVTRVSRGTLATTSAPDTVTVAANDRRKVFEIVDLLPATEYYGLTYDGSTEYPQDVILWKTAPVEGAATSFVFGAASCDKHADAPTYNRIGARAMDFWLTLGDFFYDSAAEPFSTAHRFKNIFDDYMDKVIAPIRSSFFRARTSYTVNDDHDKGTDDQDASFIDVAERYGLHYRTAYPNPPNASTNMRCSYFSWVYGRVRFIATDNRNERDPRADADDVNKRCWTVEQESWFRLQLQLAREQGQVICWINSHPWIAAVTAGADHWGGFSTYRETIANMIAAENMGASVFIVSGDMHALAYHSGVDYASAGTATIPVCHAAPIQQAGSTKGGPYEIGPVQGTDDTTNGDQYGIFTVTDSGGATIAINFKGYNNSDAEQMGSGAGVGFAVTVPTPLGTLLPVQARCWGVHNPDDGLHDALTLCLNRPALAGNLLLAFCAVDKKDAGSINFPAGWTKFVQTLGDIGGVSLAAAWRKASGGEQSVVLTHDGTLLNITGGVVEISAMLVNTDSPIHAFAATNSAAVDALVHVVGPTSPIAHFHVALACWANDSVSQAQVDGRTATGADATGYKDSAWPTWTNGFVQIAEHRLMIDANLRHTLDTIPYHRDDPAMAIAIADLVGNEASVETTLTYVDNIGTGSPGDNNAGIVVVLNKPAPTRTRALLCG